MAEPLNVNSSSGQVKSITNLMMKPEKKDDIFRIKRL